jgi:hypothetical protein
LDRNPRNCRCRLGYCEPLCASACGNVTNGCGYETYGCGGNCSTNLACFWPASVTGQKVAMGGSLPAIYYLSVLT